MGQQARWCKILEEFDFQRVHRPGVKHGNADALSRKPCGQCGNEVENVITTKLRMIEFEEIVKGTMWTMKELTKAIGKDTEISPFYREVMGGSLPMKEGKLAGASAITKSFHA